MNHILTKNIYRSLCKHYTISSSTKAVWPLCFVTEMGNANSLQT